MLPVHHPGRAGEGTCVLVHPCHEGSIHIWKLQPDVQAVWVRIDAAVLGLDKDVFLACVYIPPAGSSQLRQNSLSSRFDAFKDTILAAQELGYVMIGGDFNAKVADLDDVAVSDEEFLQDSGLPRHRGSSHARYSLHGRVLVDLCLDASPFLGTGRLPGDALAPASFSRGGSGSRIDHFLMDGCTLARVAHSGVDVRRFDSDRKPVTLTLHGPPVAAPAAGPSPSPGTRIPRLHWDGSRKAENVANMKDQAASDAIVQCHALVDSGQIEEAFHKLGDIMMDSAAQAGCKKSRASTRRKGPCKDKPYFDEECRLRAQFRHAVRHDPEAVRVQARRLSFTIRRRCRQYRQRQTPVLLRHLRSNHKCFWQRLNAQHAGLPCLTMVPGRRNIVTCVPLPPPPCSLLVPRPHLAPRLLRAWRVTSSSRRLSKLCQSSPTANRLHRLAGQRSCFGMQPTTLTRKMATD